MDRAMEGGVDDVGIGILFGLCDWRYEVLAMLQHTPTWKMFSGRTAYHQRSSNGTGHRLKHQH